MQILSSHYNNFTPSFNGIHIASSKNCIKNIETNIDLYELTSKDKSFLEALRNKINMQELMPSNRITKTEYARWKEMLELAIDKAHCHDRKSLLATTDNKPCGILTYQPGKNNYTLDCICTWPVETGKKVTLAGQTLFKQLFQNFLESKANTIKLNAILNGPFDTVSKYSRLGFKQTGGENFLVAMKTNRNNAEKTMKYLNDIISTTRYNSEKDINLAKKIEL